MTDGKKGMQRILTVGQKQWHIAKLGHTGAHAHVVPWHWPCSGYAPGQKSI